MTGTRSSQHHDGSDATATGTGKRTTHDSEKAAQAKKDKKANDRRKKQQDEARRKRQHAAAQRAEEAAVVEHAEDTDDVRRLKTDLDQTRAKLDAAQAELSKVDTQNGHEDSHLYNTIERPANLSKISIHGIRELLKLDGDEHDDEWNEIRASVRYNIDGGRFDMKRVFKEQKSRKIANVYAAIEEDCPVLRRCRNNWATERLVKDAYASRKTYGSSLKNPNTYRSRKKRERRSARQASHGSSHSQVHSDEEPSGDRSSEGEQDGKSSSSSSESEDLRDLSD